MKKTSINSLALLIASAFLASGCGGLKQMANNAHLIERSITPDPLEMHAGRVPVLITVKFPAKYFDKNAYLVVTPSVKSLQAEDQIQMRRATLQGSAVKDNNQTIDWKTGGEYTYRDTIDYSDPYRRSELILNMKAQKKGESTDVADVKIADGINVTPLLVEEGLKVDNGNLGTMTGAKGTGMAMECTVAKPTSSVSSKDLTMYYQMQQSTMTPQELKKKDVKDFIEMVKNAAADEGTLIKAIEIASYASPDGPEDMNQQLVDQRGKSGEKFAKDQLKSVDGADNVISRQTTQSEDWEGFKKAIEASNLKDKDLILRVLSMYSDPTTRERELKNIAAAYTALKSSVLPQLRRSEIKAVFQTREKSDSELSDLVKNNFDELTKDEALYATTMPSLSNAEKIEALNKYIDKYPGDWRAHNNLAVAYIKDYKLDEAEAQLNKAKGLDSKQATIYNNFGVIDLAKGESKKAKENFSKSNNIGSDEAGYNLGCILIREGEYDKAVSAFGNTPSFNKALAQVLSKDIDNAQRTLSQLNSQEGIVDYLKAICGAKLNDENIAIANLKTAVQKSPNLASYAKLDVEFIRYFDTPEFKNIVN